MSIQDHDESLSSRLEAGRKDVLDVVLKSPLIDRFGFRMSLWAGLYAGPAFLEVEQRLGVTRDENNILFSLSTYGSTTAKVISDYLGRPKNSMSRAVEKLIQRGLISRETDPTDRRRSVLSVSPEGRAIYLESSRIWRARQDHLLSMLSAVELVALDSILDKLLAVDEWDTPPAAITEDQKEYK
jgi:DNA-binding MarR family transcriptional regulator